MTKSEMANKIDAIEEVMMELETSSPELRSSVMRWLANIRDDINSFLEEYGYER
jgi:phosphopantetheine adenylyltransferase